MRARENLDQVDIGLGRSLLFIENDQLGLDTSPPKTDRGLNENRASIFSC
jgi:hypothetical protein